MTPSVGATLGMSVVAAPSRRSMRPETSASSEATSVIVIATTERKTSVRMRIAPATPMISPIGNACCCWATSTICPRIETSSPAARAGSVPVTRRS